MTACQLGGNHPGCVEAKRAPQEASLFTITPFAACSTQPKGKPADARLWLQFAAWFPSWELVPMFASF